MLKGQVTVKRPQRDAGLEIEPHFAAEAKRRMLATQNNNAGRAAKGKCPLAGKQPQSRDQAARLVGVSGKTLSHYAN